LVILAKVAWLWAQPVEGGISLKFLLETRLESEFFVPLIDLLGIQVKVLA